MTKNINNENSAAPHNEGADTKRRAESCPGQHRHEVHGGATGRGAYPHKAGEGHFDSPFPPPHPGGFGGNILFAMTGGGDLKRSIHKFINKQFAAGELRGPHLRYLFVLKDHGPMTLKELTSRAGHDKAHTTRIIADLTEKGYVEKTTPGERGFEIDLTKKGRETFVYCDRLFAEMEQKIMSRLTPEDIATVSRVIKIIQEVVEEA